MKREQRTWEDIQRDIRDYQAMVASGHDFEKDIPPKKFKRGMKVLEEDTDKNLVAIKRPKYGTPPTVKRELGKERNVGDDKAIRIDETPNEIDNNQSTIEEGSMRIEGNRRTSRRIAGRKSIEGKKSIGKKPERKISEGKISGKISEGKILEKMSEGKQPLWKPNSTKKPININTPEGSERLNKPIFSHICKDPRKVPLLPLAPGLKAPVHNFENHYMLGSSYADAVKEVQKGLQLDLIDVPLAHTFVRKDLEKEARLFDLGNDYCTSGTNIIPGFNGDLDVFFDSLFAADLKSCLRKLPLV